MARKAKKYQKEKDVVYILTECYYNNKIHTRYVKNRNLSQKSAQST